MKFLISIVSHNQGVLVDTILQDIDRFFVCGNIDVMISVTENTGHSDWRPVSERFPVEIVYNLHQKGFGENHNAAFERHESDYIFIVNPDIRLIDYFDLEVIEKSCPVFGVATPIVTSESGEVEDFCRSDITPLSLLRRKILHVKETKVDWIAGMFLIANSKTFRRLGGFDPKFRLYVEDCDLSFRVRALGGDIAVMRSHTVIHDAQRNSHKSLRYFRWHAYSILYYWWKRLKWL